MIQVDILPPIKLQTQFKINQVLPYIERIALRDDLKIYLNNDMDLAWNKLRYMLIVSQQHINRNEEHQPLQYWVNSDFNKAERIFKKSIKYN